MIPTCAGGCLAYGAVFSPTSLPIYFKDGNNQPVDPFEVKYSLYWINPACPSNPLLVVNQQTPVRGGVGYYYVSGVAGVCGGQGCWVVRWYYREASGDPQKSIDFSFTVTAPATTATSSCCCG